MGSQRRLVVPAVAMVLASAQAFPQTKQPISIDGLVVDSDGDSLPAVPLLVESSTQPDFKLVAKTDINGRYEVRGLGPGDDYVIRIDYPGFAPMELGPLVVDRDDSFRLDITLRSTAATTWVWIGGRTLDEQEQNLYLQANARIVESVRDARVPTIALVVGLLEEIDALHDVVGEDAREALRERIAEGLSESIEPGDPILLDLLTDPDATIQSMAIHILYNQDTDAWLQDSELRALLKELLDSPGENAAIGQGILMTFVLADRFEEVRSTALAMTRSADVELARQAASVIAWSHEHGNDIQGLRRLFHESTGVLRQEAANWLAQSSDLPLTLEEESLVAVELVKTMEDATLMSDFRGNAIRAARSLFGHPVVRESLLGLLEPDAWFSGIPDACRPSHSVSVVLGVLDGEPGIEDDLLALEDRLELLEEEHRSEISRMINLLSNLTRPSFDDALVTPASGSP